jgi:hypothetical protein
MSWENLSIIYKIIEYSVTLLNISVGILSVFLFCKLPFNYRLLCINFMIAAFIDLIMVCVEYLHLFTSPYLNYLEHFLTISESVLVGIFFYQVVSNKNLKKFILILILSILSFELFFFIKYSFKETNEYGSAVLSFSMCLAGLATLSEVFKKNLNKNFRKFPDTIIVSSFVGIYAILILIFFIWKLVFEYPVLATYVIMAKNVLLFVALLTISYGMRIKAKIYL